MESIGQRIRAARTGEREQPPPPDRPKCEPTACTECHMTWLLHGDGSVCLLCGSRVWWIGDE